MRKSGRRLLALALLWPVLLVPSQAPARELLAVGAQFERVFEYQNSGEYGGLGAELLRTQVYVASRTRGSAVSRVYLNGSAARYAHIPQRVAAMINLPVEVLDPFKAFGAMDGFSPQPGITHGIALAAGLALRGAPHG